MERHCSREGDHETSHPEGVMTAGQQFFQPIDTYGFKAWSPAASLWGPAIPILLTQEQGIQADRTSLNSSGDTAPLLRIAGQFAAAFGARRQGGAIPAAAERLDQRDCVHHAAAENIY